MEFLIQKYLKFYLYFFFDNKTLIDMIMSPLTMRAPLYQYITVLVHEINIRSLAAKGGGGGGFANQSQKLKGGLVIPTLY